MTKRTQLLIGIAIFVAGVTRMIIEAQTTGTLLIPGCLGNDFVVHVDTPIWQRLHCWGCYAAAFGAGVIALARMRKNPAPIHRRAGL